MADRASFRTDRAAILAGLRSRVARMEGSGRVSGRGAIPVAPAVDAALPAGGLARGAVHELLEADPGAAAGFAALMLARAGGPVLWIAPDPDAWPPGLVALGLSPADLVLVRAVGEDALWALEEALRCPAIAGAVAVCPALALTASRRLQLAAEAGGGLGLVLRPDTEAVSPTASLTRWRVEARPGTAGPRHALTDPAWRLELLKSRGGRPGAWDVTLRPDGRLETPAPAVRPVARAG